jgi:Apea-like HEPN
MAAPGYGQIYMRPVGWVDKYNTDFEGVIEGAIVRRYPPSLDDGGWLQPAPVITKSEIALAAKTYRMLDTSGSGLKLAGRRFGSAALREEDDDTVVDLSIALEAALGDKQRSEMTHKLAMRAAAIAGLAGRDGRAVFVQVKRLYDWRSSIVHGDSQERARQKFLDASGGQDPVVEAYSLVRLVLTKLVEEPDLRSAATIDERLMAGVAEQDSKPAYTKRSGTAGSDS